MPALVYLNAVAFVSSQNHPILVRTFGQERENNRDIRYHYIAHTSLDVFEERITANPKNTESYLGLLYTMDDVAVYGYITASKTKIILALSLSDTVVKDAEVVNLMKAFHTAYRSAVANPFLRLHAPADAVSDHANSLQVGGAKWKNFRRAIDDIAASTGAISAPPPPPKN
ncbi:trafficking protein particle complex 2 [Thelephora terrestris]|uniref:Trafficking protein particle complex subunit 2-like protein n=1 Tax=Thelephora terrestris TaxID=56493 RepID=A0A9P6HC84_9AGAM|nr:trafficking protein particle complex 2 [Thelephora terrestris]